MADIREVYEYYNRESLPVTWKKDLKEKLSKFKPDDLKTMEEHRLYVEVLRKLRKFISDDLELSGKHFPETIKALLTVGENGLYSDTLRFIYELIQNVDDCDFEDIENCKLDIQFVYDPKPGKIILTYNETGFTPFNVLSITGIAEESKNISADKIEIGEKGIGFKSVFGVADRVYIESGMFSFELHKDDFTIPIPKYEGFKPYKGTRLTVYLDSFHSALEIHKQLLKQYTNKDALLNKNPILFLNKLTHLRMFYDGWRYIEFDVEKKKIAEGFNYEDDISVSVDMKCNFDGSGTEIFNIISCRRYTSTIRYDAEECKARYGSDISFKERRHNLIAIFPRLDENLKNFGGKLYSFLPTQIRTSAPIVLHVPFKLDASRQWVDPQSHNRWFKHTVNDLSIFLRKVFVHLAHEVKQDIVDYLPKKHSDLFKQDDEKVSCLKMNIFKSDTFCEEPVFFCTDGSYESARNIISFDRNSAYENPERIHELLEEKEKLFIPKNKDVDMSWYGARILSDINRRLLLIGLERVSLFEEIVDILEKQENQIDYGAVISEFKNLELTREHIAVIAKHKKIANSFSEIFERSINKKASLNYCYVGTGDKPATKAKEIIKELMESADLDPDFDKYVKSIDYNLVRVDIGDSVFYLGCKNAIVVSMARPLGSFAKMSDSYDSRKTFSSTLQLRQASDKLNDADENMSNEEYIKLLRGVRQSLIGIFGKKAYSNYISVINNAGADRNRFLNELLQNADDCDFDENVEPTFTLDFSDGKLKVSYNEKGFSKNNVRAITAIGESTKKLLLNGDDRAIGEKGVGFKSVFGVAKSVDIHSNGFNFRLTGERPTIPEKCTAIENLTGTLMIYEMKEPGKIRQLFSDSRILQSCLCLRKLKKINILGISVIIKDENEKRFISLNGKTYAFEKIVEEFIIDDQEAIDSRSDNQKSISSFQEINCYLPSKDYKAEKYYLYSGLPVSNVECFIPAIIDAPFELTTARDDVLESKWNEIVRDKVYDVLCNLIEKKKNELGLDIFKYVHCHNDNGTTSFQTFSTKYLNRYDWLVRLKNMEILPCLNEDRFVKPGTDRRIVPDFIADAMTGVVSVRIFGTLLNTLHKSQYISLLELLGCTRSTPEENLGFIQDSVEYFLKEKKNRDVLYKYLAENRQVYVNRQLDGRVRNLPIYPIRTDKGTEYVSFNGKMYTHATQISNDDFLILDIAVLPVEICQTIVGYNYRINELTSEVYDARYRNNIENLIRSNMSKEEKAKLLLKEFKYNRKNLEKCKPSLMGLINLIPMEMANGEYCTGNKFINGKNLILEGPLLKYMYVSERYLEFAKYLGCEDVLTIDYSDIDLNDLEEISDVDIEDILSDFENYAEIISGFYEDGLLTDEQIEKFDLQWVVQSSVGDDDDDFDEDFPAKKVVDIKRLRKHIQDEYKNNPNPYVEKIRKVNEPQFKVNKDTYTLFMYQSRYNENKCFCQMCRRLVDKNYIERNDVQKEPKFGWSQMYLSLCLNCSKDYILRRNNASVWKRFIDEIGRANLENVETFEVHIGDRTITFTATHLAEIQEILRLPGANPIEDTIKSDSKEIIKDQMPSKIIYNLCDFLKGKGISIADKRSKGGKLWAMGGKELDSVIKETKNIFGASWTFCEKGGSATGFHSAWFTDCSK